MKHLVWIIALLLIVGPFGCATMTSGKKVESETITKIKKGETTKAQVVSMLGSPNMTHFSSGKETYIYTYSKSDAPMFGFWSGGGSQTESQQVTIMFDEKGVVEEVIYQSSKHDMR